MTSIDLSNITKTFGSVTAVDNVTLSINDGESLSILGPSGYGKSTVLRVIAGLEEPDSGTVALSGQDQTGIPAHQRDVSIVFQNFALYPHLNSLDNITLGLRHGLGLSKDEAEKRAREVAGRMRVENLLDRRPKAMSGGQRQRIALARHAGVVLLDEPMSGLDAQLHISLRAEIHELISQEGATGVTVTHDQQDAMSMADRIAVMNHGKIVQLGSPDELYDAPASTFVAGFIGAPPMNLLETGRVHPVRCLLPSGYWMPLAPRSRWDPVSSAASARKMSTWAPPRVPPPGRRRVPSSWWNPTDRFAPYTSISVARSSW
jgi:multiple sugar transport system ATP-binding protein